MPRPIARLLLLVCAPALVAGGLTAAAGAAEPPVTPAEPPAGVVQPDPPLPEQAEEALETVEEIFAGTPSPVQPEHPHVDATMALQELALLEDALPPAQEEQAERYLARPTDSQDYDPYQRGATVQTACVEDPTVPVCVHWVERSEDRVNGVPPEDDGAGGEFPGAPNERPDYVDQVLVAMEKVHRTYVTAGYRAPRPDGRSKPNGGGRETDIYLAQIGDEAIYGYCTTDDPAVDQQRSVSAYCVLDNDYDPDEFPALTPLQNMRVTAAHEYFHAVQFAYDVREDGWFMEATATWAEDEVYDSINDNVYYLRFGPLRRPAVPLDEFGGLTPYGTWIFFRYLADRWGEEDAGGVPDLVRRMWEEAGGVRGDNLYSLQAVRAVLAAEGTSLAEEFGDFARGNRRPRATYDDGGVERRYPTAPPGQRIRLTPTTERVASRFELDHLTSRTLRYVPARDLDEGWRLRVRVDLNGSGAGGVAKVLVKKAGAAVRATSIPLREDGTGAKVFGFDHGEVRWVEVVAVNASHKFDCGKRTVYSCQGRPRHDDKAQLVIGTAFRR